MAMQKSRRSFIRESAGAAGLLAILFAPVNERLSAQTANSAPRSLSENSIWL